MTEQKFIQELASCQSRFYLDSSGYLRTKNRYMVGGRRVNFCPIEEVYRVKHKENNKNLNFVHASYEMKIKNDLRAVIMTAADNRSSNLSDYASKKYLKLREKMLNVLGLKEKSDV